MNTSAATCDAIIAAADKAIQIWQADPMYGTFFGSEPRYNFDGGTQQQNCPWSESQPVINAWESRANLLTAAVPSKFMLADIMGVFSQDDAANAGKFVARRGYADDPRAALLFTPRTGPTSATNDESTIKLRWLENNIGVPNSKFTSNAYPNLHTGAYAGSTDALRAFVTAMEAFYFIKAEVYCGRGTRQRPASLQKRLHAQTSSVISPLSRKRILK